MRTAYLQHFLQYRLISKHHTAQLNPILLLAASDEIIDGSQGQLLVV
ncbi:MAG: hypothetical protein IPL99_22435 [Candidatus Competibacteraceae bacterium]|nr:hypothetical protein [Candidatus Competibacteraceae bacterium]